MVGLAWDAGSHSHVGILVPDLVLGMLRAIAMGILVPGPVLGMLGAIPMWEF